MIVPEKDGKSTVTMSTSEEPPPTYSPQVAGTNPPPGVAPDAYHQQPQPQPTPNQPPLPKAKPCNYLALTRNDNSVKGAFVIDPGLRIPPSFLPPLEDGETEGDRKNLKLMSHNGSVDVDVYLLGGERGEESPGKMTRTTMCVGSQNGWVVARLRLYTSGTGERAPYHLHASSTNGSVTIHIPRDFQGLLTLSTRESMVMSGGLSEHVTVFSEVDNVRRCFVGDLALWGDSGEWTGDEITATTKHGRVKVQFVDEPKPESTRSRGFFGRVLGL